MATANAKFNVRLRCGILFEQLLCYLLAHINCISQIALNGTEHTHPAFMQAIRNNFGDAALFLRFAPDGVILIENNGKKNLYHWEAKNAKNIERDAYQTYLKYQTAGCRIFIFVLDGGLIYFQILNKLKFIDSQAILDRYPNGKRFPVDEDGWICPPPRNGEKRTPYKEIDFSSMKPFVCLESFFASIFKPIFQKDYFAKEVWDSIQTQYNKIEETLHEH